MPSAASREHGLKYTPNAGDPALRDAIARHYRYSGMEHGRNVCVTVGSQEAMYVTLKTLLDPSRDELLVVEPAFPSYAKMATLEGVAVRAVAMRVTTILRSTRSALRQRSASGRAPSCSVPPAIQRRASSSPTAAERLVRALEGRGRRTGLDRPRRDLPRADVRRRTPGYFARIYPHTIVTNSLSKSNALTGCASAGSSDPPISSLRRSRCMHGRPPARTRSRSRSRYTCSIPPGALQEHAAWYRDRRSELLAALRESGLRFIAPEGAFMPACGCRTAHRSRRAAEELIERYDVVAIPGIAFGESHGRLAAPELGRSRRPRARRHPPHRRILRLRVTLQTFFTSMREAAAHADDVESFSLRLCRCARGMSRRRRHRQRADAAAD